METKDKKSYYITLLVLSIAFILAFKYIFPLLVGYILALPGRKIAKLFSKNKEKSRMFCGTVCILTILILLFIISFVIYKMTCEFYKLYDYLLSTPDTVESFLYNIKSKFQISGKISLILEEYGIKAENLISTLLKKIFEETAGYISKFIGAIIKGIPSAILFFITVIMSGYYFSVDSDKIKKAVISYIPKDFVNILLKIKQNVVLSMFAYLKANVTMLIITFFIVLAGLLTMSVKYALLLSFIIAIVDFFPILGAGAILIPWGIYCIVTGNLKLGIGLIILTFTITVVRRIIEPKIMAKKVGIHPLLLVISMYFGLKLAGGCGMILLPLLCGGMRDKEEKREERKEKNGV